MGKGEGWIDGADGWVRAEHPRHTYLCDGCPGSQVEDGRTKRQHVGFRVIVHVVHGFEIDQLDAAVVVRVPQNIVRLQLAVRDPFAMGKIQNIQQLEKQALDLVRFQGPEPRRGLPEVAFFLEGMERFALKDQVKIQPVRERVRQAGDARVLQQLQVRHLLVATFQFPFRCCAPNDTFDQDRGRRAPRQAAVQRRSVAVDEVVFAVGILGHLLEREERWMLCLSYFGQHGPDPPANPEGPFCPSNF